MAAQEYRWMMCCQRLEDFKPIHCHEIFLYPTVRLFQVSPSFLCSIFSNLNIWEILGRRSIQPHAYLNLKIKNLKFIDPASNDYEVLLYDSAFFCQSQTNSLLIWEYIWMTYRCMVSRWLSWSDAFFLRNTCICSFTPVISAGCGGIRLHSLSTHITELFLATM